MSIADYSVPATGTNHRAALKMPTAAQPLHRLAEVRRLQGVSCRTLARRLNTSVEQIRLQEDEYTDVPVSKLYQWQEALDVPVSELLVESGDPLSTPVLRRAQLVRLMKTARTILERSQQLSIQRMAQVLVDQLVEVMPELSEVSPWPAVGKRRGQHELGQAAYRELWTDFLPEPLE
jgi:transcriptional regulator with XRE-family HTH domain